MRKGNGGMDWRLVSFLFFIYTMSGNLTLNYAHAASVTVCDSGCNYTNIAAALSAVGSGNHTVTVQETYTRNERITVSSSGSGVGSELTIRSTNSNTMKGFTVNGNYVIIDGFNITDTDGNAGILCRNCDYGIFKNNKIHDIVYGASALKFGDGPSDTPTFNTIDHNEFYGNNYPSVTCWGSNQTFTNNNFHDIYYDAMNVWGNNHVIRSNRFTHVWEMWNAGHTDGTHADIIQTWGSADYGYVSDNVLFERNLIYDTNSQLANLQTYGSAVQNWTFRNNIIINTFSASTIGIAGAKFYNNTWWNVGWGGLGYALTFEDYNNPADHRSVCDNAVLKNNMFINVGATNSSTTGWYGGAGATPLANCPNAVADHNYVAGWAPTFSAKGATWTEIQSVNGGNPNFYSYGKPYVYADNNAGTYLGDSTHVEVNTSELSKFTVGQYLEINRDGVARQITGKFGNVVAFTPAISDYVAPNCNNYHPLNANYTDQTSCTMHIFLLGSQSTAMPPITQELNITSTSRAINAGVNIPSFSDDYKGSTRPLGSAWDIGAYQISSGTGGIIPPMRNPLYPREILVQ